NTGPGVDVEGDNSVGNQITANRIFANDNSGGLKFDGSSWVTLPNSLINTFAQSETVEASFRTTSGGAILGYQRNKAGGKVDGWYSPVLYVGSDGKLYGELQVGSGSFMIVSPGVVSDGRWHNAALVVDGASQTLYLDGQTVGSGSGAINNP